MASAVGLDIGTSGVRVVEAVASPRSVSIKKALAMPLKPGIIVDGEVRDPAGLTAALRILWGDSRLSHAKANIVVGSHPMVTIRSHDMLYLPRAGDRDAVVAADAKIVMPNAAEGMYIGHHVADIYNHVDLDTSEKTLRAQVALVGVNKSSLDSMLDCVVRAGINLNSVDITDFALARMVSKASSGGSLIDVIIHVGATSVTITGLRNNQFVYQTNKNQFSGDALTLDIADGLNISVEEAERSKVLFGVTELRPGEPNPNTAISQWVTSLVREIHDSINEMIQAHGMPVGRVWVSGGGRGLPMIASRLSAVLDPTAQVALLEPTGWVSNPEKLDDVRKTGQDITAALAAAIQR